MSDAYDRAAEFLDRAIEDGLVSADGQTCGDGVSYAAETIPERCDDPECAACRGLIIESQEPAIRYDLTVPEQPGRIEDNTANPPAIRSDGFTIRCVMEDGTLGEPVEGLVGAAITLTDEVSPALPVFSAFAAWAARLTPEELADLADCRDRVPGFQEWHDSLPWNRR